MIVRFAVENFRSICTRQELSLVPSNFDGDLSAISIPSNQNPGTLKVAAVFGANASGKSTLLNALWFFSNAVRVSHSQWQPGKRIGIRPFAFASERKPSVFELEFVLGGNRYIYGFSLDDEVVHEEWLYHFPNKKQVKIFKRSETTKFSYGESFKGNKKLIESSVRSNSLFLSAAAQNNHKELTPIFTWISDWNWVGPDRTLDLNATLKLCQDEDFKKLALPLLLSADLGITDIEVKKEKIDKRTKAIFEAMILAAEMESLPFEGSPFDAPSFSLLHKGRDGLRIPFRKNDESNGTIAYLSLLGRCIMAIATGQVLLADELDSSLHPALANNLVLLFNSDQNTMGAQLIFNTHNVTVLDGQFLRRDQVWFTEKDDDGSTTLYPLTDYKPRKEENLTKGYMSGKFGGVPYLGDFYSILKGAMEHDSSVKGKE